MLILNLNILKRVKDQSNIFFTYIKVPTGYYQKNKERPQKESCERFLRKKKTKSKNMHVKVIKIFLKKKMIKNVSITVNAKSTSKFLI